MQRVYNVSFRQHKLCPAKNIFTLLMRCKIIYDWLIEFYKSLSHVCGIFQKVKMTRKVQNCKTVVNDKTTWFEGYSFIYITKSCFFNYLQQRIKCLPDESWPACRMFPISDNCASSFTSIFPYIIDYSFHWCIKSQKC